MTSCCWGAMAAMIFMGWPHERQNSGSSCQTLAMSLAQERFRLRRNSGSWSALESGGVEEGVEGIAGRGAPEN